MVPLLNYYLDDSVRQAVCAAIPKLIACCVFNAVNQKIEMEF